jgi:hypothetical protein
MAEKIKGENNGDICRDKIEPIRLSLLKNLDIFKRIDSGEGHGECCLEPRVQPIRK